MRESLTLCTKSIIWVIHGEIDRDVGVRDRSAGRGGETPRKVAGEKVTSGTRRLSYLREVQSKDAMVVGAGANSTVRMALFLEGESGLSLRNNLAG